MVEQHLRLFAGRSVYQVDDARRYSCLLHDAIGWTTASGAFSDARATVVQPAARAGATFRAWIETGKFHGVRQMATPAGRERGHMPAIGILLGENASPWLAALLGEMAKVLRRELDLADGLDNPLAGLEREHRADGWCG